MPKHFIKTFAKKDKEEVALLCFDINLTVFGWNFQKTAKVRPVKSEFVGNLYRGLSVNCQ